MHTAGLVCGLEYSTYLMPERLVLDQHASGTFSTFDLSQEAKKHPKASFHSKIFNSIEKSRHLFIF